MSCSFIDVVTYCNRALLRGQYLNIFFLESCFARHRDFPGQNVKDLQSPNPRECQKWCQRTKECDMFIYATKSFDQEAKSNNCFLKKGMPDRLDTVFGLVAGPKFCHNGGGNFH